VSDTLALQLELAAQSSDCLSFRLLMRNTSSAKLLVPRPAVSSLRLGNMATGKESPWRVKWLVSAPWTGFFFESGEVRQVDYRVRPAAVDGPAENSSSEYARCCVDLPAADYLVWLKFEVNQDYLCGDSHYRYADLVWEALSGTALVWTGQSMSNRVNVIWR
jgi:hypothetical protein